MTETLFNQILQAQVKCKDCEDRRANIRVSIELKSTSNPVHKKDLVVRITDDIDPYFLYNLVISEEDFQSLKVQQGLLVDFSAFPQKFIDLLHQCIQEQDKDNPRFLLQFLSSTPVLDHTPAHLNIVETNAFKHLTHLSLKLLHGTDVEIKKYLAICLTCVKAQTKYQQQSEQQRRELESLHQKNIEQLQTRLVKLETCNKEMTERKYQLESIIRDHAAKLLGLEDESHRAKQEVLSLRRENSTLDLECHEKEKHINQLQTRVAVLEQEIKDKDQLVIRSKEVLDATQEQKLAIEENAKRTQLHIGKLEAAVQSLSEELIKANEIIKKLQGDVKTLGGKLKLKNSVTIQQEKLLSEKEEKLKKEQKELHDVQHALQLKKEEVQFNPLMSKPSVSPVDMKPGAPTAQNAHAFSNKENGEPFGLESKYFQKREDSIPLRGIVQNKELQVGAAHSSSKPGPYSAASAYFPGQ
ncbi:Spindle assembly abnormal protein 6-like [Acipenser ruthenus]|uniref:Spindle assembly abnormal protein 6-like n=1 Tax=Acipenser ruthenus TaxID=7906 RepID=A0A444TYV0_ACIRT|nr:Spindle assembly abnormal protein 6-like [Acipenser ruthenus]